MLTNKIFITGGTGFIGKELIAKLNSKNLDFIYSYRRQPIPDLIKEGIKMDLTKEKDFKKNSLKLQDVKTLIHLAAFVPKKVNFNKAMDYEANILNNVIIFSNIEKYFKNLEKIIFLSSCYTELNNNDSGYYGVGKKIIEQILDYKSKTENINCISLRFPQIYGWGNNNFISQFIKSVFLNKKIYLINNGLNKKDLIYVKDVIDNIFKSITLKKSGVFTITSKHSYSIREVLDLIIKLINKNYKNIRLAQDRRILYNYHFQNSNLKNYFKIKFDLEKGLKDMIAAYKKYV